MIKIKRTIRENVVRLPYCLHDARVNKIKIKLLDEDDSWVQGNILFKQVDLVFSRH